VRRLLVTANVAPSSPILVTLIMEALSSSETSVLTRAMRRKSTEDGILQFIYILNKDHMYDNGMLSRHHTIRRHISEEAVLFFIAVRTTNPKISWRHFCLSREVGSYLMNDKQEIRLARTGFLHSGGGTDLYGQARAPDGLRLTFPREHANGAVGATDTSRARLQADWRSSAHGRR
jgi:hypothetical protein